MKKNEQEFINFLENKINNIRRDKEEILKDIVSSNHCKDFDEFLERIYSTKEGSKWYKLRKEEDLTMKLLNFIGSSREDFIKNRATYTEFNFLSKCLIESNLNSRDKIEFIFDFLEKMLKLGLYENGVVNLLIIQIEDLEKVNNKFIDQDYLMEVINNENKLIYIMRSEDKYLSKMDLEIKKESLKIIKNNKTLAENICKNILIIKKCYLDKKDSFNKEDISKVKEALIESGFSEEISDIAFYHLNKKYEKRPKENNKVKGIVVDIEKDIRNIQEKEDERKKLIEELKGYYDFKHHKKIKDLTNDEINRCASIAFKLGYNKKELREFFFNMRVKPPELHKGDDVILFYESIKEKIEYYKDKLEIVNETKFLEECYEEFKKTNDEFWRESLIEYLVKITRLLPDNFKIKPINTNIDKLVDNYDYELSKAEKLSKVLKPKE